MSVSQQVLELGDPWEVEGFTGHEQQSDFDRHRIAKLMIATFVVGAGLGAVFLAPYFPWQIDPAGRRTGALVGGTLAMWGLGVVGLFTTPRFADLPERFFYMGLVTFVLGFATATFIRQTGWHVSRADAPIFARLVDGTLYFGGFVWVVSTLTAAVGSSSTAASSAGGTCRVPQCSTCSITSRQSTRSRQCRRFRSSRNPTGTRGLAKPRVPNKWLAGTGGARQKKGS
jgi:hypothetical protein